MPPRRGSTTSLAGAALLALLVVAAPLARGGVDLPVQLAAAALAGLALALVTRGSDRASGDRGPSDRTSADRTSGDRNSASRTSADRSPSDRTSASRPSADRGPSDRTSASRPSADRTSSDRFPGSRTSADRSPSDRSPFARAPWVALPLLLVVTWSALQVLPLAGGRAISLDPPASGRELATAVAKLLAFVAAWAVAGTQRRREVVLVALGSSGLAVAFTVLLAALLGLGPLLEPKVPFVNPNHLSGFLCLTAFPVLGLALRRRGQARLLWLLGFVVVVAALFLSLSRGGIGAFFGGVAVFLALTTRRELPPGEAPHPWRWAALAGLTAALGAVAYLALEPVVRELSTLRTAGDDVKLELLRPALAMIRERPLTGIGRGAFATAFTAYKSDPGFVTFTHLENEWVQPLIDLGAPAGLLLVGTLGLIWLSAARRRDLSTVEVGLLAGTAAVAAQNAVDFSLEFAGVGLPFMVALGLLTRGAGGVRLRWRWLAGGAAVAVGAALAGAWFWQAHPTDDDGLAVLMAPTAAEAAVAATEAARWHPADYLPVATAGARWVEEGRCAPAMPWLTRAMALNPTAPEPHLYLARCLAAAGQGPLARREYRLAWLYGRGDALGEAAGRWEGVAELLQVAPDSADGQLALGYLLLSRARPADAARVFRLALEGSGEPRALLPLASALFTAGELEEALELARRRTREAPTDPEGWRLTATVLLAEGYDDEARVALEEGLGFNAGSPPLTEALVQRSLAARRPAEARRLAESMAARTPGELATRQALIAATLAAQGRLGEAIDRARSAAAALPDAPWPLLTVAAYCQQAGRLDDAIAAVERASSLPGQQRETYRARLDELVKARAAQADRRMTEDLLK